MSDSFISTPADIYKDSKEFDAWDKKNKNRKQKIPELSKNLKLNKIKYKKMEKINE